MPDQSNQPKSPTADERDSLPESSREYDFDELLEHFSKRCRSGKNPTIEKYAKKFPQHAEQIRSLFPAIQMMEQFKDEQDQHFDQDDQNQLDHLPDVIEDYQIIREIGRGGMGVVYEAVQKTLQRRVALKLLHVDANSSRKRIARFIREARSAAKLHHTNIVPVFGFGEHNKNHYYAMQYIDGVTVEDVIEAIKATLIVDGSPDGSPGNSSAVAHAFALRRGLYIKPRKVDSISSDYSSSSDLSSGGASKSDLVPSASQIRAEELSRNPDAPKPSEANELDSTRGPSSRTLAHSVDDQFANDIPRNSQSDSQDISPPAAQSPSNDTLDLFKQTNESSKQATNLAEASTRSAKKKKKSKLVVEQPAMDQLGKPFFKSVARIAFQIADGLHYAHNSRVIHRDIKPANLIMDAQGIVWVTDFGLAKPLEQDDLTKTGDTIGTLRYMSPEQIDGKVDRRCDIYSLGLTLYELATLQPAFGQTTHGKLFKSKSKGVVTQPRKICPQIPADLETIILKAIALEPDDRYQTAGSMATDLQLFLEDRPIDSRRASTLEKLTSWGRRNPALAALTSLAALLLVMTAVVATTAYFQTRAALKTAEAANRNAETNWLEAVASRQDADDNAIQANLAELSAMANLNLAMDAFEGIAENLALRGLPDSFEFELSDTVPLSSTVTVTNADAELLEKLLTFYEQFARQSSDETVQRKQDEIVQRKKAKAYYWSGVIHNRLQQFETAEQSFSDSIEIYDDLLAADSGSSDLEQAELIVGKANVLSELGTMYHLKNDFGNLLWNYGRLRKLLVDANEEFPRNDDVRAALAASYSKMSSLMIQSGAAETGFLSASDVGKTESRKSRFLDFIRDFKDPAETPIELARREQLRAEEIFSELSSSHPGRADYRFELAKSQRNLMILSIRLSRHQDSDKYFRAAIKTLEELTFATPDHPGYQFALAEIYSMATPKLSSIENSEQAKNYLEMALKTCSQLADAFPNVVDYQMLMANCYRKLALIDLENDEFVAAEKRFESAAQELTRMLEESPSSISLMISLTLNQKQFADSLRATGIKNDSKKEIQRAKLILGESIRRLERFRRQNTSPFLLRIQSSLHNSLAECHFELGEFEQGFRAESRAASFDRPFRRPRSMPRFK